MGHVGEVLDNECYLRRGHIGEVLDQETVTVGRAVLERYWILSVT